MAVERIRTNERTAAAVAADQMMRRYPTMAMSVGLLLMRVPLGAMMIMAGVMKFSIKPDGVQSFVSMALPNATRFMSESMGRTFLTSLPWIEIGLGALLIVGLLGRVVAFLLAALLTSIVVAMTPNFDALLTESSKTVVMAGLALGLAFTGVGLISVDGLLFGPKRRVRVTEEYVAPLGA